MTDPIRPPSPWLAALELPRALLEFGSVPLAVPSLATAPRGDGHPVLILPGFLATDVSTSLLRLYLRGLGYDVHRWALGRNMGWRTIGRECEHLADRLDTAARGDSKVSLIGWSLGGFMARQIARRQPDRVRQVITMGSPITGDPRATAASSLFRRVTGEDLDGARMQAMFAESRLPVPVPATAIFSDSDGVVPPQNCIEPASGCSDNIIVHSSHVGLTVNPLVLYAIADRLARPDGAWVPFDRSGWRRLFYAGAS